MNEQFKVLTIKSDGSNRREVYLLNPGDTFAGFGGSRHGLTVRKTASLIVRDVGPHGCRDVEYNLNDADAWRAIRTTLAFPNISIS